MDATPEPPAAATAPPSPTSTNSTSSLSSPPSPPPSQDDDSASTKSPSSPSPPSPVVLNPRAEEEKKRGNDFFRENRFHSAIEHYQKAIELDPANPSYYSNLSFCHFKLEEYGSAIEVAGKCLIIDTRFIKGNYRRGDAYLALGKYRDARKDFQQVLKYKSDDKDAKAKLHECERKIREELFRKAIENEKTRPPSEVVDVKSIEVDASYDGPHLEEGKVTPDFMKALIARFIEGKRLHRRYVYEIVLQAIKIFSSLATVVDITVPEGKEISVFGDTHGQFYDVCNIFDINGLPSEENPCLFNGDFVDRGSWSYEVIVTFLAFKVLYPNHFHMTRGNHESTNMNSIYGFQGEIQQKVDSQLAYDLFTECFNWLPLGVVINKKVMVVHGGLFSEDGVKLDQLKKIDRNQQPPESGLMCEMLWADPQDNKGRAPSKRGVGFSFGPDVTKKFLADNDLSMIVRSHEVKDDGYEVMHDGKLVTVFSAPNYCDTMGNKGAFIRFDSQMNPRYTKFDAVKHPEVKPMAYASGMFRGGF